MTCNCNGETPEYTIILDNVGLDGYSPTVGVIDVTEQKFNITLTDLNGTETTPNIPKLEYLEDTYVSNTSLASTLSAYSTTVQMNTALSSKLDTDGSNADSVVTLNRLTVSTLNASNITSENLLGTKLIQGTFDYPIRIEPSYGRDLWLNTDGSGKVLYNNNEIATLNDIPSVPTVGNGTITFTQGGVTKGTITTNQSGNTTIELDAGGSELTNPLVISNEAGTRNLTLGINESNNKVIATYGIVSGGGGFNVPIHFLYSASNPLALTERSEDGLYTLSLNVDNDTIKVNQDGQLYADVQGGSSYTEGTGIDITNDVISVDSTVVALQSDLPTNYLTTDTSQTVSSGTKTMASGTSQVFVSGSSLDVRGNNTLFFRGASQAQGGYLGLAARSRDTVNDVAINIIRLQANTTGDLANLRLQGYDLYNSPYLYNGFTRLGRVNISSGNVNITTESGVELQYNGSEVATINDIPDLSIINGGNANA